jgi:hypothetical protein
MQKRCDAALKAGSEWSEKMSRFLENTRKALSALVPVSVQVEAYRRGCSDPISADDPAALEKLSARLEHLQEYQEHMKAVNAHYRKHKTAKGCPGVSNEVAAKIDDASANGFSFEKDRPFQSFDLQNNNANIARIKERIAQIEKARARASIRCSMSDFIRDETRFM